MNKNKLGSTDMEISALSLGGAAFSDIYGKFQEDEGVKLIRKSLSEGINYLETGPWYGQGSSERTVGKALQGIPRNSYFIGSKVGRYDTQLNKMFDFSKEKTEAGINNTLQLLGLDYVDIIQVHDLAFGDKSVVLKETLPTLQKAVEDGKARYIGLADYDIEFMIDVIEDTDVKISSILSYAKCTLLDNRLQKHVKYFKDKGIGVINASATGMGLLTNNGPQSWHPADKDTKELCKQASEYCKINGVELGRISTWWTFQQAGVDTHMCGIHTCEQLIDTIDLLKHGLNDKETAVLQHVLTMFSDKVPLHWDSVEINEYKLKMRNL